MKQFHKLLTNTTSLVGYIAVLMFFGAYLGGDETFAFNPALIKGNILESGNMSGYTSENISAKSVTLMIDGRQYEARIIREVEKTPTLHY